MKVIAFYLPQFHQIPENDKWWGKGFTEWTNVKKAKPLFENHNQPRIPLNNNYYNLLDIQTLRWQADLATKYGVYGFCMYHYWFGGKKLLEKPIELFLKNKDIKTHFCLCWANEDWTNQWAAGEKPKTLIREIYGGKKEWKEHFNYLLQFFKDDRYIKENNCPLLVIYRPELIKDFKPMMDLFREEAIKNGFNGIKIAYQDVEYELTKDYDENNFDYAIEYQPGRILAYDELSSKNILIKIKKKTVILLEKIHINLKQHKPTLNLRHYDYDEIWTKIVKQKPKTEKSIPGAFVDWDNTPRKEKRGFVIDGASPEKFQKYFNSQIKNVKKHYKTDMLFIFAWNEWAEGGYLEPDTKNKYGYLEAIKKSLIENSELPNT